VAKRAKIQGIPTNKALNPTLIRGWLDSRAQDQRQLRKTDGALHEKRQRKARHEPRPCLMDRKVALQQVCERPIVLHGLGESCRWALLSNEKPSTALCGARSFFVGYRTILHQEMIPICRFLFNTLILHNCISKIYTETSIILLIKSY